MDSVISTLEAWISSTQLLNATFMMIVMVIVALFSSYATYYFTRKRQLEAEWRKDKLKYYSQLLDSITEMMSMPGDDKKVYKQFAHTCNAVVLFAPQKVTDILFEFYYAQQSTFEQKEIHEEEEKDKWVSDQRQRLKQLVLAMRKDLRIKLRDDPKTFQYRLRSPLFFED